MRRLATPARYEAFVREGTKGSYQEEWYPGDSAPFLEAAERKVSGSLGLYTVGCARGELWSLWLWKEGQAPTIFREVR